MLISVYSKVTQFIYIHVLAIQSCLTLCDPMDRSSPGSSVHGIIQAKILEWVAISFSIHAYLHTCVCVCVCVCVYSFIFFSILVSCRILNVVPCTIH